jgi:hypothetical protein
MANLTFRFLANDAGLKKGIKDSKKQLSGLDKATKKISGSMKAALGGLGLGVGLASLVSGLKEATKAAVADQKSQAILADTLRNVTNASDEQIASVEARIKVMQNELAITDDELRPAYSKLVGVLGDTDSAMTALSLAADVSAGTGKDLNTIAGALSKAFAGNRGAIDKLVPGLDKTKNVLEELSGRYSGLAKTAAENDPFTKLTVIFGELQEQLGTYLLPYLQAFTEYLTSEEGQIYMQNLVTNIGNFVIGLANSVDWLTKNFEWIKNIALMWAAVTVGIKAAQIAMGVYSIATGTATIATANLGKVMKKSGWLALALILGSLVADQVTAEPDYGDLSIPNIDQQLGSALTGRSESDPLALLIKQMNDLKKVDTKPLGKIGKVVDEVAKRMQKAAATIKDAGQSFRDSVDLAFGLNDSGNRFSTERFIRQLTRAVEAAKKLPGLLAKIRAGKTTGSTDIVNQLSTMEPIQAAAIAEGLLSGGRLQEIGSLRNQLTKAGMQTALAGGGANAYTININKANISPTEIVNLIKQYERSTGKKVLLG